MSYQPLTGEKCFCRKGIERDNCSACEGIGMKIDFKKIREMPTVDNVLKLDDNELIKFVNSEKAKDFFSIIKWKEGYVYSRSSFTYCQTTLRQVLKKNN